MKRSAIRELAFKLIYSIEIQKPKDIEEQTELYFECENIVEDDAKEYIIEAINGTEEHKEEKNE